MVTVFDFKLFFLIIFIFGHVQSVVIVLETCKDSSLFLFFFSIFFYLFLTLIATFTFIDRSSKKMSF
jgi:hypothetical protein